MGENTQLFASADRLRRRLSFLLASEHEQTLGRLQCLAWLPQRTKSKNAALPHLHGYGPIAFVLTCTDEHRLPTAPAPGTRVGKHPATGSPDPD